MRITFLLKFHIYLMVTHLLVNYLLVDVISQTD